MLFYLTRVAPSFTWVLWLMSERRVLKSHLQHLYEYPHYQCDSVRSVLFTIYLISGHNRTRTYNNWLTVRRDKPISPYAPLLFCSLSELRYRNLLYVEQALCLWAIRLFAGEENFEISTLALTGRHSASELLTNL